MKYSRNLKTFTGQLDVAPFAGVFFLLVIFLLLNTHLVPPPGVRLELPESTGPEAAPMVPPALFVAVDAGGQYYFEHQAVSEKALRERLTSKVRSIKPPVSLLIQADAAVRLDVVTTLSGIAREAGVQEVVIARRPKLFPGPSSTNAPPTP